MFQIIKANGEKEVFSEEKLRISIHRAGVPDDLQDKVVEKITEKLYQNITTSEIYQYIIDFLDQTNHPAKTKYSLKRAIMELGPSGYPFEDFVAKVLNAHGFATNVRVIAQGNCISHEIDVVAQKDEKRIMIEAKFHNLVGTKTKVHVALYTKARFEDVKEKNNFHEAWLITNTKTTTDVITFLRCNNMKIISWGYPEGESLRDLIEKAGLTPITAVSELSRAQKQQLLVHHVVLCKDVCQNPSYLDILGLDPEKKEKVLREMEYACRV